MDWLPAGPLLYMLNYLSGPGCVLVACLTLILKFSMQPKIFTFLSLLYIFM